MPTRKVKGLARNTKYSHSHKILVALEHHKFTQYSVSWPPSANAWIVRHCWTLVQQRLRLRLCTSNNAVYSRRFLKYIYTSLFKIMILFVYKTKATRPILKPTKPRPVFVVPRPVLSQDRGFRPHHHTTSQTFPADVIYGRPLDITWLYLVTGSALAVVGPSLSLVRRSGTCYRTVSTTRCSPATVSDSRWRWICFVVITQHRVQNNPGFFVNQPGGFSWGFYWVFCGFFLNFNVQC